MYYPDMGTECMVGEGPHVRAVGWLSDDHSFTRGTVDPAFLDALRKQVSSAWQPFAAGGGHLCEFCLPPNRAGGSLNLWIPSEHHLFLAPVLIVHYIEAHNYRPPEPFIQAVLSCPPQRTAEYFIRMRPFWEDEFWGEYPLQPGK